MVYRRKNIEDLQSLRDCPSQMLKLTFYERGVSLALAKVLNDIGLSNTGRWRTTSRTLQWEAVQNVTSICVDEPVVTYRFGSLSEGTTTSGLNSDSDVLACPDIVHLLLDESHKFLYVVPNYLIIQSESFPGYVKLQLVGVDDEDGRIVPMCKNLFQIDKEHVYDKNLRVVLPNSYLKKGLTAEFDEMNGPALSRNESEIEVALDYVVAHRCNAYHSSLDEWSQRQRNWDWPKEEVIEKVIKAEYFVVPIGHPFDDESHLLWRMSFSIAERILVQHLNIVQIQCYVLMKMILKKLVKPHVESVPSSYHCKMVLLYMAEQTPSNIWRAANLVRCFQQYLYRLIYAIEQGSCPHYLLKNRNMFVGKMKGRNKVELLKILKNLLSDGLRCFLCLECDSIGAALSQQLSGMYQDGIRSDLCEEYLRETHHIYTSFLFDALAKYRNELLEYLAAVNDQEASLIRHRFVLKRLEQWPLEPSTESVMQKQAANWMLPFVKNSLGSLLASLAKVRAGDGSLFAEAEQLLKESLDSDMTSSRLKLAAIYMDCGRTEDAKVLLSDVDKLLRTPHEYACRCYKFQRYLSEYSHDLVSSQFFARELHMERSAAFCVVYLPHETNLIPYPLQFEMYRAICEDGEEASNALYAWFDWVVIDSRSFLYYLQALLNHKEDDQSYAFMQNQDVLDDDPNLGHLETAKNVMASMMIREREYKLAFDFLWESFDKRPRNNAFKWHIGILLRKMLNSHFWTDDTTVIYERRAWSE